ncbi:MarR family winged helix-turn-helix transcriptional regulator [Papillibacter cinnamivorans]|uniref:DNA-binding transcriptional regulator, MarR family n=1 Tax=Papillibacter cinnamivorans DSM 12816 TaxID=1122930 RepID=A0A1W2BXY1_9FIRM|nr:MarR family transcriptional regulator [Papillibacter cinnamivorans]SMC77492.1 DNA-binding transcriptional regulator, MarR family [Papillibacter cinnamivorans DSM 12816]
MPKEEYSRLNTFLVDTFNVILKTEEKALSSGRFGELSIREMHIIETVCAANREGGSNRTTDIAQDQGVTPGTLTVAINRLVRKGYIRRLQDEDDKRIIRLYPTRKGEEANRHHERFHQNMVLAVTNRLDQAELETLERALEVIRTYFNSNLQEELWQSES